MLQICGTVTLVYSERSKQHLLGTVFFLPSMLVESCPSNPKVMLVPRLYKEYMKIFVCSISMNGTWAEGGTTYKDFIAHIAKLEKDRTWAKSVDIYMAAVALRVDIVSINEAFQEMKSEIIRPLMDKALLKHVPAVREILKQSRSVQIVVGNIDCLGMGNRPNHYVYLHPIRCRLPQLQPFLKEMEIDAKAIEHVGESPLTNNTVKSQEESMDTEPSVKQNRSVQPHKRSVQHVVTKAQKLSVVNWMIQQENDCVENIPSKAVLKFPMFFRQKNTNTNIQKARRWFLQRFEIANEAKSLYTSSLFHSGPRRKISLKAGQGRGRKRAEWVEWLHWELLDEFDRLSSSGVKFSNDLLQLLAKRIILESEHKTFNRHYVDPKDHEEKKLNEKITYAWVKTFMERFDTVSRKQTEKLMVSEEKQLSIEREVAYHLGCVKRDFDSGALNEDLVENMDETHFIVNMDDKRTLAFKGSDVIKYADVVSGGDGMTLVVRITGGSQAKIYSSMMIFQNKDRNYPIRGLQDNIPGICYRTGPKGWMDRKLFAEWVAETRANPQDPHGRQKVIFLDNCGGHNDTVESTTALRELNAVLRKLPANATDLCQPADSFIISKIKDVWKREWERKKIELIDDKKFSNKERADGQWSGKLKNPGKRYFLELAQRAVAEVNSQRDENGMSYARKAMIKCGLSKEPLSGEWKETQLFEHLQVIIHKHREYFEGKLPPN